MPWKGLELGLGFSAHTPCAEEQLSGRFGTGPTVPRGRQPLAAIGVSRDGLGGPYRPVGLMYGCAAPAEVGQEPSHSNSISPTSFSSVSPSRSTNLTLSRREQQQQLSR